MTNNINVAVVAVSTKKEQGWIKCQTLGGKSWNDLGMHFDKVKFSDIFETAGIFEIEYSSVTSIETGYTSYLVENATLIKSFTSILKG
ncbi:hypothetical protein [Lactococcus lactis]|uniref:hypothetical protein n=1 Tax=Lactococcus lactis TaxID=1358 RepID=UPI0007601CA2|nr:hypothetical protein [Lactococcus lactis]KWT48632.1 hypothetical protein ABB41_04575 [Lactococcus lactis]MDT2852242.1 hypothetical protein [Lactococcus lactis]HAV94294.1 hypothetical protein [Lactococcus lactis]